MFVVRRSNHNPIISPNSERIWESYAVFNGCPIETKNSIKMVYRAVSTPQKFENQTFMMSTIGLADSPDGVHFKNHRQFIVPEKEWERYGCEDPRVTKIDDKYYIFYTALGTFPFSAPGIRTAVAISTDMESIQEKHLVTPFNAKAMTLFPEKINGKFTAVLSAHTDMRPSKTAIAQFDREEDMWSETFWKNWHDTIDSRILNLKRGDNERVEIGAPPIKTKYGWLLIYSHITKYGVPDTVFGVEAVLLDSDDPTKIIARTSGPFLVPQEQYEKYGTVPNIVFPTGALVDGKILRIYYGGADTVCAVASVRLQDLLNSMLEGPDSIAIRSERNPILKPTNFDWERRAVFNPAVLYHKGIFHILYRAMSMDNTSTIGYAASKNGEKIIRRDPDPIYVPREAFEMKGVPNGNSGCEDPRLTVVGDRVYMCYTAFNGLQPPAVALTSVSMADFERQQWHWTKPVIISPTGIDDKDACIVPVNHHKNAHQLLIHRIDGAICVSDINLTVPLPPVEHKIILRPRTGMWDGKKVGLSAPPIYTRHGWLLIYHGVSDNAVYRVGIALLDPNDPTKVIARTTNYIFEPKEQYEIEGQIKNVVFPCGAVIKGTTLYMYYGGADSVLGVATMKVKKIFDMLSTSDL
jgi:predicted GH43/DUF377 family glycosyl hydrolase